MLYKIESLSDYINKTSDDRHKRLVDNIYITAMNPDNDYKNFKKWFYSKQMMGVNSGKRNIYFVRNPNNTAEIIALVCLKKENNEKKICMIYVKDDFRNKGIGASLLKKSFEWLGTTKPLITFSEHKYFLFKSIIEKYNWKLIESISRENGLSQKELCFNGRLSK